MTGVTTNIVPGWTVYTISSATALNKTITATTTGTPTINILMAGGGGGANGGNPNHIWWYSGGGGGGRFLERSKTINSTTPTQTFTCTLPARSTGAVGGGTTSLTFSDPLVGDISCGGGGYGWRYGGNTPINGGSGGGGGANEYYDIGLGGPGVFGYEGGGGGRSFTGINYGGGGGGAGGAGENATNSSHGSPGPGLPATLAGIKSVYTSGYTFCSGGSAGGAGSTYGGGATTAFQNNTTGNPGVIIIAVPT